MAMNKIVMQTLRIIIAFALLATTNPSLGSYDAFSDDAITLSFDNLFPSTPYKDALGACMQLLGYLNQLCNEHDRGELASFELVHDAFVGKIVAAQHKVKILVSSIHKGAIVADDNVDYLNAVLSYISKRYNDRIVKDECAMLASSMIDEMTQQLLGISDL